jgi:2-amino-4-hydroxy-6-hydroxymethyldihydropteridine diphosphokinase
LTGTRRAYLGIGSNLGDRLAHLQSAVDGLDATPGVEVVAVSRVYETDPVGGPEQGEYLNAVVAVTTDLSARELLAAGQRLEAAADRVPTERWGPRTLDVDILVLEDEVVDEPDLQIPHARMRERGFVMAPLGDVAPDRADPSAGWTGVHGTDLSLRVP